MLYMLCQQFKLEKHVGIGLVIVNQPVFFRIAHARAEMGGLGGRKGKNSLAKLRGFRGIIYLTSRFWCDQ